MRHIIRKICDARMHRAIEFVVPSQRVVMIAVHGGLAATAYLLAHVLDYEFSFPPSAVGLFLVTVPILLLIRLATFGWFHLYEGLWRYVGIRDVLTILWSVTVSSLIFAAAALTFFGPNFPKVTLLLDWVLCFLLVGGVRVAFRALWEARRNGQNGGKRALVVGAGDAGDMLVREIERNPSLHYKVVGFVDDDPVKQGRRIHGLEVLGTIDQLSDVCLAHAVQEVLIAIPSATGRQMRRIIGACRARRIEFKTVPSLTELMDPRFTISRVRRVNIDDLLRREPVTIDHGEIEQFVRGKAVLVTGAGGSIGSELCRQVARFEPRSLILVERGENSLFFIEMELRERFPNLSLFPVIADVTDLRRMEAVFQCYRPNVVFHAAAHKHVPLMEMNRTEAVKNNVLGTKVVADTAMHRGVNDFVMISTDKAVRPISIMGATKRLAEMYVQSLNPRSETRFTTVRFGNVLGSEGSVLQIFQRQIEHGGPITITHPDMKRYFMTIPEASQLVLQAATQGKGGEIFVLDMGEPVQIVDLAKDLIALSGLDPERDIEIKFTGVRPGEKIFEELLSAETRVVPTSHLKVMVVETDPLDLDELERRILELLDSAHAGDEEGVLSRLRELVPDYQPGRVGAEDSPGSRDGRILVIEDDTYTRMTLKRVLETSYQVRETKDYRGALQHVQAWRPDLVILGHELPDTNVQRLCARLKRENGGVPVMLVGDSAEAVSPQVVSDLGADDRIYRPIPVDILRGRVRRLLAHGAPENGERARREA